MYSERVAGSSRDGAWALALGLGTTLVCLGFVHTTPSDAYWTGDCANKALVAERLLATGFRNPDFDHPARAVDPAWHAFPLPDLSIPRGDGRVSVFPLVYPAVAAPFLALLGPAGLRWPAALGVGVCAALFAVWLAPVFGRWVALAAGAFLALGTPLFFYGVTVWEHSLTVALVLLAAVLLQRPGRTAAFVGGASLGLAGWLREELVLMGLVFALVEYLRTRDTRRTLALCAGGGVCGVVLATFNLAVYGSMLGPHAAALDPALALRQTGMSELATRIASLVVGRTGGPAEAWGLFAIAVVAVAAGGIAEWRCRLRGPAFAAAVAVGLGCWALAILRIAQGPPLVGLVSYNGLLPQIPMVGLAGIGAVRVMRSDALAPLRPAILAGLVFALLAMALGLLTQSVFGMGLHVSPRKLLPALPTWVALALAAVWVPGTAAPKRGVALSAALLVVAGVASSAVAGYLLHHQKVEAAELQDAVSGRSEPFAVSGDAMLTQALTGIWHEEPLLYAPHEAVLREVVAAMRARGVRRFLVLASEATPIRDPQLGVRCRRLQRYRGAVVGYWDTDILSCAVRPGG